MLDFTNNLNSLGFEAGLSEDEKKALFLRSRSAGLTVSGCAHAVFVCDLFRLLRKKLNDEDGCTSKTHLSVGILGGGHMGKQLAMLLLHASSLKPCHINISTKRPESLGEISNIGVKCYFDNIRLAKWADLLFLCVLPSHLPQVCSDIRCHLSSSCLVYSFTSAVPLNRLAMLLDHRFIIKPQYEFVACDDVTAIWLLHNQVTTALMHKEVLSASLPLSMNGGLFLDQRWVSAVLYSLLNMCTAEKLGSGKTLRLLNGLFETGVSTKTFTYHSFVNSPSASDPNKPDDLFPWINLVDAQSKDTPLTDLVSRSKDFCHTRPKYI
ncbi:NADP-dependent oxidoreductase domain-containing protein 1 isoform X2 [Ctenopharyngodon idella]|uniref:NADP-dependent oxidoreductase domain-containing protein 1 isoform X2 n=1 Tax=Ctenopharyngodon idella TaxID=7959 RepID=UPI002231DB67|nr:NADP-dependent oxidoreductase domain-containing protein 1 isoform X2 [Ctenopharyngodon idella]